MVVLNESPFLISAQNSSGLQSFAVTGYCADAFLVPNGFSGGLSLIPISIFNNQIASAAPSSVVFIITYAANENITLALKGGLSTGYPMPLPRLSNVGNALTTVGSGATLLQNDNSAVGTQIIEATPTGASGSTISMDNNGNFFIKQWISSTLTQLFQIISNAAANADNVKLSDAAHQVHVLGTLLCDLAVTMSSTLAVTGNTTIGGTLGVTGASTFTGDITTTGKIIANGVGTTINGSVAGTVTFFTPVWGTALKMLLIVTSTNYNDVTARTFIFPSAIITAMYFFGNQGSSTVAFKNGATTENSDVITALASGGGSQVNVASVSRNSFGQYDATTNADRVVFTPGGAINNGIFLFIGA